MRDWVCIPWAAAAAATAAASAAAATDTIMISTFVASSEAPPTPAAKVACSACSQQEGRTRWILSILKYPGVGIQVCDTGAKEKMKNSVFDPSYGKFKRFSEPNFFNVWNQSSGDRCFFMMMYNPNPKCNLNHQAFQIIPTYGLFGKLALLLLNLVEGTQGW